MSLLLLETFTCRSSKLTRDLQIRWAFYESCERNFERTYVNSYQQNYESNVSSDKTTGNISRKTDQFIISSENTLEAKQNETQLEDLSDGNWTHGKLQKRRSRSKSTSISKGARRDKEPLRLPWKKILHLFNKNKAIKRYVRSHIVNSVPHLSALKKISSFDYRNYLKTRMCRSKLVRITRPKLKVQGFCYWLCLCFQNKNCEAYMKSHIKYQLFFMMNL